MCGTGTTGCQFSHWWKPACGVCWVYLVGCGVGDNTFAIWALPWEHVSLARIAQVVCCLCFLSGSSVVKDLAVRIREPDRDYTGDILV